MARARNIKPGFFMNDELAELDPLARLLFAGLWCIADRRGRLEDRPKRIKSELLSYDDCDCDKLLESLKDNGFILRYSVDGVRYIQVINFDKHQNPHKNEAESTIPPPCDNTEESDKHSTSTVQAPETHNTNRADSLNLIPDSLNLIPDSLNLIPDSSLRASAPTPDKPDDLDVFTKDLRETVSDWFAYKTEKRQPYKPTGRKSLITEIQNNVKQHGESAVVEVIRQSMGSNYQGIVWDRLGKSNGGHIIPSAAPPPSSQPRKYQSKPFATANVIGERERAAVDGMADYLAKTKGADAL